MVQEDCNLCSFIFVGGVGLTLTNKSVYKLVYCPGGFNYDKMNFASKLMMKMFLSMLKANKEKTSKDMEMINMISSNYDISHKKYIEPILNFLK